MSVILDGDGAVLGRLSSRTAKLLLAGEEVIVLNAEKIVITGDKQFVKKRYLEKLSIGSPQHGPYFPRHADTIVRRAIRGMLPYKKAKGLAALRRLRVYKGAPEGLKGDIKPMKREIRSPCIKVGELSRIMNG